MILTTEKELRGFHRMHYQSGVIVATNGCFDVLHYGHVEYLRAASQYGHQLVVGINDDAGVRALKGPSRPFNTALWRAGMLNELRCVDAVYIFKGTKATKFLSLIKPSIYVKGGDYNLEKLDKEERAVLERMYVNIHFVPLVDGISTTELIRRGRVSECCPQ